MHTKFGASEDTDSKMEHKWSLFACSCPASRKNQTKQSPVLSTVPHSVHFLTLFHYHLSILDLHLSNGQHNPTSYIMSFNRPTCMNRRLRNILSDFLLLPSIHPKPLIAIPHRTLKLLHLFVSSKAPH